MKYSSLYLCWFQTSNVLYICQSSYSLPNSGSIVDRFILPHKKMKSFVTIKLRELFINSHKHYEVLEIKAWRLCFRSVVFHSSRKQALITIFQLKYMWDGQVLILVYMHIYIHVTLLSIYSICRFSTTVSSHVKTKWNNGKKLKKMIPSITSSFSSFVRFCGLNNTYSSYIYKSSTKIENVNIICQHIEEHVDFISLKM